MVAAARRDIAASRSANGDGASRASSFATRGVVAVVVAVVSRVLLAGRLADRTARLFGGGERGGPARFLRRRHALDLEAKQPLVRPHLGQTHPRQRFPRRTRARAVKPTPPGMALGRTPPGTPGTPGTPRDAPRDAPGDTSEAAEPGVHPRGSRESVPSPRCLGGAERARAERPPRDDGLAVLRELEQQQALHLVLLVPPRAQTRLVARELLLPLAAAAVGLRLHALLAVPRAHERLLLRPPQRRGRPHLRAVLRRQRGARIRAQGVPAAREHELLYRVRGEHLLERRRAVHDGARGNRRPREPSPPGRLPDPPFADGRVRRSRRSRSQRSRLGSPFPTDGAPNRGAPLRPPSRRTYPPIAVSRYARASPCCPCTSPRVCGTTPNRPAPPPRARSRPPRGTSRARPGPAGARRGSPRAPSRRSRPRNWGRASRHSRPVRSCAGARCFSAPANPRRRGEERKLEAAVARVHVRAQRPEGVGVKHAQGARQPDRELRPARPRGGTGSGTSPSSCARSGRESPPRPAEEKFRDARRRRETPPSPPPAPTPARSASPRSQPRASSAASESRARASAASARLSSTMRVRSGGDDDDGSAAARLPRADSRSRRSAHVSSGASAMRAASAPAAGTRVRRTSTDAPWGTWPKLRNAFLCFGRFQ